MKESELMDKIIEMQDRGLSSEVMEVLKKHQKRENVKVEIPYGYVEKGGKLQPDKIELEVVKWIFYSYLCYMQNPPKRLVDRLKTEQQIKTRKYLLAEEVHGEVTGKIIERYICAELSIRLGQFDELKKVDDPEEIRYYLSCPLSAELFEKIVVRTFSFDDTGYLKLINKIKNNPVYVGHLVYTNGNEKLRVRNAHEPIISEEIFGAVSGCVTNDKSMGRKIR